MTDKDAAQVLRDNGWLVVEPGKFSLVFDERVMDGICQRYEVYYYNGPKKPKPIPDTIDWSHVAPEYKYMARDEDGLAILYTQRPFIDPCDGSRWWTSDQGDEAMAKSFTSYKRGTVDWKDSLVLRDDE